MNRVKHREKDRQDKKNITVWNLTSQHEEVQPNIQLPWLDIRLTEETMNYLWNFINNKPTIIKGELAGNITKSMNIQDKDNWFYENVLKRCAETIYFKDWENYYNVYIAKTISPPVFTLKLLWVNYQLQHEFNPPHNHPAKYSFVVFMKIPTHWKEQHAQPVSVYSNSPMASDFQFLMPHQHPPVYNIPLSPEDEGRMVFFPGGLLHQVFPFYGTEEERITVSGNIIIKGGELKENEILQSKIEQQIKEHNVNTGGEIVFAI